MIRILSILIIINFAVSNSVLSERYTTLLELEEKINQWDQEFSNNENPYSTSAIHNVADGSCEIQKCKWLIENDTWA